MAGMTGATVLAGTTAYGQAAATSRILGTITATATGSVTVKTDAGAEHRITVPDGIKIQRVAPGAKDLSSADTIQFSDLSIGDRVLVRLAPDSTTDPVTAASIVAIGKAELAQKQQQDQEDWQRNGIGGLVKGVDDGTGVITVVSGAGAMQKTITVHTSPATVLKRYAADSTDYDQAKPAPIETIQTGDQVRARGTKNADGTELTAKEVVSGSFRNISGVLSSVNAANQTITLKDLITKQNVTVHIGKDTQMHKLPENMAKMLASMTKPSSGRAGGAPGGGGGAQEGQRNWNGAQAGGSRSGGGAGEGGSGRRGDLQSMLSRAPAIHVADLQKGEAVMLVSTVGAHDVQAITLLAGVEPLLEAPAETQNMLLSNWSMSSGSAEAAQ
jgi:hypothetical protein